MKTILGLELGNIRSAHNSFLTFFAELGAVGLLAYLAVVTSIIHTGVRLFRKGGSVRARWLGVAVIAVMIAHLMPAVFSDTIQRTRLWLIYPYVFVGSIAGLYRPLPSGSAVPLTPHPSTAVADPDARFLPMEP